MAGDIDRLVRFSDKTRFSYLGTDRTYLFYFPPQHSPHKKWPLVLVLHGGGANGENAMRMADMEGLADREGFILLYPDGAGRPGDRVFTWNAGRCCAYALESNSDDSGYLAALVDFFILKHGADPKRIYVSGLSNGSMMAHRFAAEHSERVAAIAAVAGGFNIDGVEPKHPVSVIAFHGLLDRHAPYDGGVGEKSLFKRTDRPVREGMGLWARWNGCSQNPEREENPAGWTREQYTAGRGGSDVVFYTLKNQAHAWPGGRPGLRYGNTDPPDPHLPATDLIWQFFKSHPKL